MDILISAAVSALGGLTYAAFGYWNAHKAEDLDIKKMLPTIVYGLITGVAAAFLSTEIAASPQAAFLAGITGSVFVGKFLGGFQDVSKEEIKAGVKL